MIVDLETIMAEAQGPSELKEDVADVSLFLLRLSCFILFISLFFPHVLDRRVECVYGHA